MFPVHNPDGHPVAFLGRAAPGAPARVPRYLNTRDTPIYHKGQTLYGLAEQADRIAGRVGAGHCGRPRRRPRRLAGPPRHRGSAGSRSPPAAPASPRHHVATIAAMPGATRHGITAAFDNDPAGRAATLRAWQLLPIGAGIDLYAARLPDGADPADLIATNQTATLRAALSHQADPLVEAVIDLRLDQLIGYHPDLLDHPGGQVMAARALAHLLIDLPADQIVALDRSHRPPHRRRHRHRRQRGHRRPRTSPTPRCATRPPDPPPKPPPGPAAPPPRPAAVAAAARPTRSGLPAARHPRSRHAATRHRIPPRPRRHRPTPTPLNPAHRHPSPRPARRNLGSSA